MGSARSRGRWRLTAFGRQIRSLAVAVEYVATESVSHEYVPPQFPAFVGIGITAELTTVLQRSAFDGWVVASKYRIASEYGIATQFRRIQPQLRWIQPAVAAQQRNTTIDATFYSLGVSPVHSAFDSVCQPTFDPANDAFDHGPLDPAKYARGKYPSQPWRHRIR